MRLSRRTAALVIAAFLTLALAGCAAGANPAAAQSPDAAGFWLGLWQGFIAPIAFLVSLVNESVGVYEVRNSGGWYDFGFVAGMSMFFSGGGAGARGRSRHARSRDRRSS